MIGIEDAAQHLATRIEITIDGEQDEPRLASAAMQMASGILRQASGGMASLSGRPVDVNVRVLVDGRSVLMHSNSLHVVPERGLLAKLASTLEGVGRVRVLGGYVPQRATMPPPKEVMKAFVDALGALSIAVFIIIGIRYGIFTPTEAGALAVIYAVLVGAFWHRELKLSQAYPILLEATLATAVIMLRL